MSKIIKRETVREQKGWGYEDVIINCEKYCGKILHFYKGSTLSFHFHIEKDETWHVNSGCFILKLIDTDNADKYEIELHPGDVVNIKPGQPHQIITIEEGDIFEVSSEHFYNDSYRIEKGDSQNESLG